MAEDMILPLLGYNGDDEEDDTTDSEDGIDNDMDLDNENDGNKSNRQRVVYDTTLPSQHNYLGQDLNELSGRVMLDEIVNIPLLSLQNVVLVPSQTLPLQLHHPTIVSMIRKVIEGQRTVGIVASYEPTLGTTAEIRSYADEDDGEGLPTFKLKAEGRQRFRVINTWRQDGVIMGKVKILPEYELTNPLRIKNQSPNGPTLAMCSRWPKWVYELYDANLLMDKIKVYLKNWSFNGGQSQAPLKPCEFSYWIAANLPLDDQQRCQLLNIDSSIQRLRFELSLLQKYSYLCCSECKTKICEKDDVIVMSSNGPQGTYVNSHGAVHEMMTVSKASNLSLYGRPSTESSWFPGYAWTICRCSRCHSHMGWRFTCVDKNSRPDTFWGLCRASLEPGLKIDDELPWKPVL
ncbi:protein cereblon-like [Oppia nitens]|uniref:protein cereblon-like n=1 Tax=Oppia nitens TaxID=1686743 RepID=UPI0023D9A820|nr:protein cereblon-like [Oppia nitens]